MDIVLHAQRLGHSEQITTRPPQPNADHSMNPTSRRLLIAFASCGILAHTGADPIRIRTSESVLPLVRRWTEIYSTNNPGVRFNCSAGSIEAALKASHDKSTDLVVTTRPLRPPEVAELRSAFGRRPTSYKVAMDAVSIFVPTRSIVTELHINEARRLFSGEIRNWKELGGEDGTVTIYTRMNGSSASEFFRSRVMHDASFARLAIPLASTAQVIQSVANDVRAVGFAGPANSRSVRALKIRTDDDAPAVEPKEETISAGTYPLSYAIHVHLNPAVDTDQIEAFLNWIRGDEGQKTVRQNGFFPLPKNLRQE